MRTGHALLLTTLLLSACGGPRVTDTGNGGGDDTTATPTPPPGQPQLHDGVYTWTVDAAPSNTCWNPSKNMPTLPMVVQETFAISGSTVSVTADMFGAPATFALTLSGTTLTGSGGGDADLSSQGVDCTIHVDSAFSATITADDHFSASQQVGIHTVSGSQCSLLVGNLDPRQFDTMPCSMTLTGDGAK
jgi:hypothetical protein